MEQKDNTRSGYFHPSLKTWKSIRRAARMLAFLGTLSWLAGLASALIAGDDYGLIFLGINFFILIGWWMCQMWAWIGSVICYLFISMLWIMNKSVAGGIAFLGFGLLIYILLLPGFGSKPEESEG